MMNLLEIIKFGGLEYKYNHMEFVFEDAEGERHEYRLTSGIDDIKAVVNSTDKKLARDIVRLEEKGFKHTFYTIEEYHTALDMAIKALDKCDRIEKIINSNDADL